MGALRMTGDRDALRKRAITADRLHKHGRSGGTVTASGLAISGERVRVTRSGTGEGWRLSATAAERAPHGAVNAHNDAASVRESKGDPFTIGTTTNTAATGIDVGRSSFGDEGGSPPNPDIRGHYHRVNGAKVECTCGIR